MPTLAVHHLQALNTRRCLLAALAATLAASSVVVAHPLTDVRIHTPCRTHALLGALCGIPRRRHNRSLLVPSVSVVPGNAFSSVQQYKNHAPALHQGHHDPPASRSAGCLAQQASGGNSADAAVSGGRRALLATTAGLLTEAFWNYPYNATTPANPIPTSTKVDHTASAASINYPAVATGGLADLSEQTAHYAIRFSGGLQCCLGACPDASDCCALAICSPQICSLCDRPSR